MEFRLAKTQEPLLFKEGREDEEGREEGREGVLLLDAVVVAEGRRRRKGRGGGREGGREGGEEEEERRGVRGSTRKDEGGREEGVRCTRAERASHVKSWAWGEEGKEERMEEGGEAGVGEERNMLSSDEEEYTDDGDPPPSLPPFLPLLPFTLPGVVFIPPKTTPSSLPSSPSSSSCSCSVSSTIWYNFRKN